MPTRQFLWLAPRLNCLSTSPPTLAPNAALRHQRRPIHDPPIRPRPAVGQRRWLAFHAAHDPTTTIFAEPLLSTSELDPVSRFPDSTLFEDGAGFPKDATVLERLLRAVQCRDLPRITPLFIKWSEELLDQDINVRQAAHSELGKLPTATFSEILRWIDPVANPANDVIYGMNITVGQTQFLDSARHVDHHGVRTRHLAVLTAIDVVMNARRKTKSHMVTQDYEIAIRCAGAASLPSAAITFYGDMTKDGLMRKRHTGVWTELTKALSLIDPLYYQFDRTRVVILPRATVREHEKQVESRNLWAMERLRLSLNAWSRRPFNRSRTCITKDLRMYFRKKEAARWQWIQSRISGVLIDEPFLCASMVTWARSNNFARIKGDIIKRGFELDITEDAESGAISVERGTNFRPGNPRTASQLFLNAIVESLGSMGRIRAALNILVYASYKWDAPIPHKTWTNLLIWTYVAASKTVRRMRTLQGNYAVYNISSKDVVEVWKIMTSDPFNIKPSFEDYNVYIKALIVQRNYRAALDVIRNEMVPFYRRIEEGHYNVVEDEILQEKTGASYQRTQIEARKEYVWYHISTWFDDIIKTASKGKMQRNGQFMQVVIPDLIAEFGEFFQTSIRYRTAQGIVSLRRSHIPRRYTHVYEERTTTPTLYGGMLIKSLQKKEQLPSSIYDGDFVWPQYQPLNIRQSGRKPLERNRSRRIAPESGDVKAPQWWRELEKELCR